MAIVKHYSISQIENKYAPMEHHLLGLSYTRTGYGKKIPTDKMVRLPGSKVWRRVYCYIYSNIGTLYIETNKGKDWITFSE